MKLDIAFLVAGMAFDGSTLKTKSLGGSETAGACVARELAKRGHRVMMFSNCDRPGMYDGVRYLPAASFQNYALTTPHDVCVVQRLPEMFSNRTCARLNLLWCHDLALARSKKNFTGMLWNVDKVLVVSEFMADQYREVYGLEDELLHVARNGIDLDMLGPGKIERRNDLIVYTARPERGLDVMLERVFPRILEMRPDAKLAVAGYDNQVEHLRPFYQRINELMMGLGDRVEWRGHLSKPQLYDLYREAALYVYPTPSPMMADFVETSCITAMECMALGLPFVSTNRGALPKTLADGAGLLLEVPTNGELWGDDASAILAGEVVNLLSDRQRREHMGEVGRQAAPGHSWEGIAVEWEDQMLRMIDDLNDDPVRLAYHFVRRSDIVAAQSALDEVLLAKPGTHSEDAVSSAQDLRARIDEHWGFARTPESYAKQYQSIGWDHTHAAYEVEGQQHRLHVFIDWLRKHCAAHPDCKRMLDIGCAHGAYTTHVSNALPDLEIEGVDIDARGIEIAEWNRENHAEHPGQLSFRIGTENDLPEAAYDVAFAGEILEHVPEPWAFLTKLHQTVKPGGWIYITVPWGPWEHMSYLTYPNRAHLWEYDPHDLDDLIGNQAGCVIDSEAAGQSTLTGEMIGWYHISYQVTDKPVGKIDMARKLRLQRPRQTVSASIMAGGPAVSETMRWCLNSFREIVDEIVVADCGLSDSDRNVLENEYGARIFPSPSPLEIGFEGPRNIALDQCRMDWVFWIDMDERLVDPARLDKYLRENRFHGYCLRQHHFSIDHPLDTDMPVRLYRRRPVPDGRRMRHYGMLHEHPELAINEGPGLVVCLADTGLAHVGYLSEDIRRKRFARNLPMLQKDVEKYPDRLLQKHFLCRDKMLLASYELQRNGNQVTPEIKALAKEVVELYQTHFLGNQIYANIDTLPYYSQACQLLGIGIDVEFSVRANRDGVGQPLNGAHHRFASKEDALKEMTARATAAMQELDVARYW